MTLIADSLYTTRRETAASYRGRAIMLELEPCSIRLREKGRREWFTLPFEAAYDLAMKLEARRKLEEKNKERAIFGKKPLKLRKGA